MIVNDLAKSVTAVGFTQTAAASVKATAHGMRVLSKSLYSYPIYAVVREIMSNAYDANQMLAATAPVLVILPSVKDSTLYIKDNGPGISDQRMMSEYLRFFESNKGGSNDQIGGFGVGCKAPYAYTECFTVVSRPKGMGVEYQYMCYTDETGEYRIGKVSEEATSKPSGFEVIVPIKQRDFNEFETAVKTYYPCFPAGSIRILGSADSFDITPTLSGTSWALGNVTDYDSHIRNSSYVCVGPVPYSVDWYQVQSTSMERALVRMGLELKLPIGSADINPSRENLNMTEKTVASIRSALSVAVQEITAIKQLEVDACESEWEAYIAADAINEKLHCFPSLSSSGTFVWRGKTCTGGITVENAEIVSRGSLNNRKVAIGVDRSKRIIYPSNNLFVVIDDLKDVPNTKARIRYRLSAKLDQLGSSAAILLSDDPNAFSAFPAERVSKLSDIKLPTYRKPSNTMGARLYTYEYSKWKLEESITTPDDMDENIVYVRVDMNRSTPASPDVVGMLALPTLTSRTKVIGFSASARKVYSDLYDKCVAVEDMFDKRVTELFAHPTLFSYLRSMAEYKACQNSGALSDKNWIEQWIIKCDDQEIIDAWGPAGAELREATKAAVNPVAPDDVGWADIADFEYLQLNAPHLVPEHIRSEITPVDMNFRDTVNAVIEKYPLLVFAKHFSLYSMKTSDIVAFINTVEGNR